MADNVTFQTADVATPPDATVVATDDVGGVQFQKMKLDVGADGVSAPLSNDNPVPISDAGGSVTVDGPLTDTELRASDVPVSVASLPLPSGAATAANQSTEITALGSLLTELQAKTEPADTQVVGDGGGSLTVDGTVGLTGTVPLPTGASTEATLALIKAKTDNLDVALSTRTKPADTQAVSAASLPLPSGASTLAEQQTQTTAIGGLTETAPGTDTASSGLNGRLQRIAQRLTSLIALLPTALGSGGGLKIDGSGTALPVSGTVTANAGSNLNTSALALDATVSSGNTLIGAVTETAPATDTASSGLNGRLQRVAQRLTSIIALLPTALGAGGGLKVDGSGTDLPVSGTVTANAGTNLNTSALALDATLSTTNTSIGATNETAPGTDTATSGLNGRLQRVAQRLTSLIALLPSALVGGRLDVNLGGLASGTALDSNSGTKSAGTQRVVIATDQPQLTNKLLVTPDANSSVNFNQIAGTGTSVNSGTKDAGTQRVVLATDQPALTNALLVTPKTTTTPTQSTVASSASNVTILASNANRLGATVYNDSTVGLYLKLGATASSSSFSVKMPAGSYYEVPFSYTGIIDGIWESATGNARITELTA